MEYEELNMGKALDHSVPSLIKYDTHGLIGVEAATAYWGLSTFTPEIPIFLVNDEREDNDGYFTEYAICYLFVPNVNTDNVVQLSEHLYVTDREQTICDMIRYNRHEFHLFETVLSAYEDSDVDVEKLERLASEYNILDRLRTVYIDAVKDFEEEY